METHHDHPTLCPCQSGKAFTQCCEPYLTGKASAPTPSALMRSRYTAFTLNKHDYLKATWAPQTRPDTLDTEGDTQWIGLSILAASPITESSKTGSVHFRATYYESAQLRYLEEISQFECISGQWFYVDGQVSFGTLKPKRNEPCPCGSGKKYKVCCGR